MCHCGVAAEGKCYTFGSNQFRQLGFDKEPQDRRPGLLRALTSYSITTVACGDTFTVAVTDGMYSRDFEFYDSQNGLQIVMVYHGARLFLETFKNCIFMNICLLYKFLNSF